MRFMYSRKLIRFRICTWVLGAALSLFSLLVFRHENGLLWELVRVYNEVNTLISFVPVASVALAVESFNRKDHVISTLLKIAGLVCGCILYVSVWAATSGGV